ncbi:MAG: CDP-2,3-bis-(O-geranylgeranyl)-sn-glycerol synthase [Halobaculum sp.]
MLVSVVVGALWVVLPAYLPNNAAVVAGGGRPIDGGATWRGRRVLGDGKTWRGTAVGTAVGTLAAVGLNAVADPLGTAVGVTLPTIQFPAAAVGLALGAMVGDIAASFLKRRLDRERGAAVPGLDQLDFLIGALALAALAAPAWFGAVFTLPRLAVVVLATPVLHVATNVVAYQLGLKDEPW